MFYSHEILTSRKHGVATIWLVATLGSKSSLKKISRRAILNVDVSKACETIADPESPMALRLQSSLLYGVSRVFSQQCGYVLTDMQSLHDKMRGLSMVIRDLQIDSSVQLADSNQLNLQIDPNFNIDFDLGLDLSILEPFSDTTDRSSLLSPHSRISTQSSLVPEEEGLADLTALSSRASATDNFFFDFDAGAGTDSVEKPRYTRSSEEPGIDQNPLFDIADDGMIVERPASRMTVTGIREESPLPAFQHTLGASNNTQDDVMPLADTQIFGNVDVDEGLVFIADDDDTISHRLASAISDPSEYANISKQESTELPALELPTNNEESATTAEAPYRRIRKSRPMVADQVTEITNRQLSDWQDEYNDNMLRATSEKVTERSLAQARRDAYFWVLSQGVGGVSVNFGNDREIHPLSVFSGHTLWEALSGHRQSIAGRKRSFDAVDTDDEEEDARRIRNGSERNVGRSEHQPITTYEDDGILIQADDNDDVEPQMGRQPVSSLKDQPSSMPWNIIGSSLQGSVYGSVHYGISSSVRGLGIDIGPHSTISGRRSRLTSASPLVGRGRPPSRLHSLDPQPQEESFDLDIDDSVDLFAGAADSAEEDFELYGPAAAVSTQQAAQSQWLAAALANETQNFLVFLDVKITSGAQIGEEESTITFENLLPPTQNSNVVAAQGFLHVLTLATRGLINVQQNEEFGDIFLGVIKSRDGGFKTDDEMQDVGEG